MTEQARSSGGRPHGTLAEEAAKLAELARQWLGERSTAGLGDVWAAATGSAGTGSGTDDASPECRTCPICRAKRLVAGLDPAVLEHLSDAAASVSAAARAMGQDGDPARRR